MNLTLGEVIDKPLLKELQIMKEGAEQLERVNSLFAELEIPPPYDLWLAESLQIRELLKKRKEFYVDDLHKCNEQGLHGKSLHYESIIEELNLLLGHKHNWKYFEHIKYCKPCGIYKTISDKEQQKILGEKK